MIDLTFTHNGSTYFLYRGFYGDYVVDLPDEGTSHFSNATDALEMLAEWAELLEFDPETDLEYRKWCRENGLVAGSEIE